MIMDAKIVDQGQGQDLDHGSVQPRPRKKRKKVTIRTIHERPFLSTIVAMMTTTT